jgi:hypothetical protein
MPITDPGDWRALREAAANLEDPSFIVEVANYVGIPVQRLVRVLPDKFAAKSQEITQRAILRALKVALRSLGQTKSPARVTDARHTAATVLSGGVGGLFGLPGTLVELPVTTVIILRSIAEIARREGEDLESPEARLACIEVFALGGRSTADDSADAGYFAVRAALGKAISDAASFVAQRGVTEHGAPVIVRLVAQIASRFGIVVSEKAAAQALPVAGAVGGATINLLFTRHFQRMARGHFTIRRLERKYGPDVVRAEYERVTKMAGGAAQSGMARPA